MTKNNSEWQQKLTQLYSKKTEKAEDQDKETVQFQSLLTVILGERLQFVQCSWQGFYCFFNLEFGFISVNSIRMESGVWIFIVLSIVVVCVKVVLCLVFLFNNFLLNVFNWLSRSLPSLK